MGEVWRLHEPRPRSHSDRARRASWGETPHKAPVNYKNFIELCMVFRIEGYIDTQKHFSVPRDCLDISKITDAKDKNRIIAAISRAIETKKLTFKGSYLKHLDLKKTQQAFLALAAKRPPELLQRNLGTCDVRASYDPEFVVLMMVLRKAPLWLNEASEIFQRDERCKVEVNGHSLWSLWHDPDRVSLWLYKLGQWMGRPSAVNLGSYMLRKCMTGHKSYATQFPCFSAKGVYSMLKSKRVLDPCFGWGDRFAAAFCTQTVVSFHGIDPRKGAKNGFQQQDKLYREWLPHKVIKTQFTQGRAEKIKLTAKHYDTIFTSPPFFDKENYKNIGSFRSLDAWFQTFLQPMIDNVWQALAGGGHLVLHLEDDDKRPISNWMNTYISRQLGAMYKGIICMPKNERPGIKERGGSEPMWVWLKA